jgi:hypothetical protein
VGGDIFIGKPEERHLAGPRHRWEANVKNNIVLVWRVMN